MTQCESERFVAHLIRGLRWQDSEPFAGAAGECRRCAGDLMVDGQRAKVRLVQAEFDASGEVVLEVNRAKEGISLPRTGCSGTVDSNSSGRLPEVVDRLTKQRTDLCCLCLTGVGPWVSVLGGLSRTDGGRRVRRVCARGIG